MEMYYSLLPFLITLESIGFVFAIKWALTFCKFVSLVQNII